MSSSCVYHYSSFSQRKKQFIYSVVRWNFVSFMMNISGVEFQEYRSNISRNIFLFSNFSSTAYNETHSNQGHLTKFSTSLTGKKSWNLSKNYPSHHAIHYKPGAHQQKPAITPYSCHGVFTDRSIFSLNLSRIQIPTGTSVTNCNQCWHVDVMSTCSRDVSSVSPSSERMANAPAKRQLSNLFTVAKLHCQLSW